MSGLIQWTVGRLVARRRERGDEERGQGLVEYGLILILIAIVVIITLTIVGKQTNNLFSNVNSGLAA